MALGLGEHLLCFFLGVLVGVVGFEGSIGFYLRPIQGYDARLEETSLSAQIENVREKPLYFLPVLLPKAGDGAMVRRLIGRNHLEANAPLA